MKFYRIVGRSLMPEWGDYGHMLQHGMAAHLPRRNERLSLERTGPYVPPVTLPGVGDVVLTDSAKAVLQSSKLTGYTLRAVEKVHIAALSWASWDLSAPEPPIFPDSGEPEDYILGQQHSAETADAVGDLWEIVVLPTVKILRSEKIVFPPSNEGFRVDVNTWNGDDLFRGVGFGSILFSERARNFFSEHWSMYVGFEEFSTT